MRLTSDRCAELLVLVAVATTLEPTEEMITTAMTKADARVCAGTDRCYAFPDPLAGSGRETWDVWVEMSTGLVKLIPQADA